MLDRILVSFVCCSHEEVPTWYYCLGSCAVHIASLGFPVVAFEPVRQHVDTIRGSMDINPSFAIELHFSGVSYHENIIRANFGHGGRNWGASSFHEVAANETAETELELRTLDRTMSNRKVSLLKIDCEGCEYEALKGFVNLVHAKRLHKSLIALKCF